MNNNTSHKRPKFTHGVMLQDESHEPASNSLINLQEQTTFQFDDKKGAFAMLNDLDDEKVELKSEVNNNPRTINEPKSKQ